VERKKKHAVAGPTSRGFTKRGRKKACPFQRLRKKKKEVGPRKKGNAGPFVADLSIPRPREKKIKKREELPIHASNQRKR